MKSKWSIMAAFLFLLVSCGQDDLDVGTCRGADCMQAKGYVYNSVTFEPLAAASIQLTFKENCGWCGTGCLFREFAIAQLSTDENGYFQTNFSAKDFRNMMGTYAFTIQYDNFNEAAVAITNEQQSELQIDARVSPPAFLRFSVQLPENTTYFGLSISSDSLSASLMEGYNSDEQGLFSDTSLLFKVPAEQLMYYGYLLITDKGEQYGKDTVFVASETTSDIFID